MRMPEPLLYWPSTNYAMFNGVILDIFQIESISQATEEGSPGCSARKVCVIQMKSGATHVFGGEYGANLWERLSARVPNII